MRLEPEVVGSSDPADRSVCYTDTDDTAQSSAERKHRNALKLDQQWLDSIGDETPLINPIPLIYAIRDEISDFDCRETVDNANSLSEVHLS